MNINLASHISSANGIGKTTFIKKKVHSIVFEDNEKTSLSLYIYRDQMPITKQHHNGPKNKEDTMTWTGVVGGGGGLTTKIMGG